MVILGLFGLPSQPCPRPTIHPLQRPCNPSITHLWLLRSLYLKHPSVTSQIRHQAWGPKHFSQRSWQRASQWLLARVFLFPLIVSYSNHTYVSPTDNLVTPVTQKLNAAKKKHFTKFVSQVSQINIDFDICLGRPNRCNSSLLPERTTNLARLKKILTKQYYRKRRLQRIKWRSMMRILSRSFIFTPYLAGPISGISERYWLHTLSDTPIRSLCNVL